MRIHPAAPGGGGKNKKDLRRLPHVYSKVLELPLPADTDVAVFEGPDAFHFVAAAAGAVVRVRTVRIHPGVVKVVVHQDDGGEDDEAAADDDDMDIDRWRSRLPESSCPTMAVAGYVDGQLVVSVPKGREGSHGGETSEGGVNWRCGNGGKSSGRLVVVQ